MSKEPLPAQPGRTGRRKTYLIDGTLVSVLVIPILSVMGWLAYQSTIDGECLGIRNITAASRWFDPVFFQYNLALATVAILIFPCVPFIYVNSMAWRKKDRLLRELPLEARGQVNFRMEQRSSFRFYFGSASLATAVVALGISILLLLKPVRDASQCGVDFSKGANMLMLGPFIGLYNGSGDPKGIDALYTHLVDGLVGFQFGFLGAYTYSLTALTRAYFTLDLTPETLVDTSIRIGVASVLSLVLSFGADKLGVRDLLPIISFFFGFFPGRALAFLEEFVLKTVKIIPTTTYHATPLSVLHGMSYAQELRLQREGFDSAENLGHANAVDLAVRTGFAYRQLRQWISEAWMVAHLRDDYTDFVQRTGITSREELEHYFTTVPDDPMARLLLGGDEKDQNLGRLRSKLTVIRALLRTKAPDASSPVLLNGEPVHAAANS